MMKCPKCSTESLREFTIETVAVDRCSSCDGIWFDAQELSALLTEDAKRVALLQGGTVREQLDEMKGVCPRDGARLLRMYSAVDPQVVLDACADCHGIWLDGGEFERLFAASRR